MMSLPCDRKGDFGGADHRLDVHGGEVVAVEIDIEDADRDHALLEGFDLRGQPLRQRHAAAADADEGELVEILASFPESHAPGGPACGRSPRRS